MSELQLLIKKYEDRLEVLNKMYKISDNLKIHSIKELLYKIAVTEEFLNDLKDYAKLL